MRRLAILLAALVLGLPGAAFAQGAGDDQYQDPFGDEPSSQTGGGGGGGAGSDDGGLSDEPPVPGGGGSGSNGSDPSGGGTAPSTSDAEAPPAPAEGPAALPRTGSEPLLLVGLGAAFLLTGVGLRLRTIDPNAF